MERYISEHISPEPGNMRRLDRLTNIRLLNGRMCSGHIQGRILKMLTTMIRPKRVLELGTFSGYSALSIAEGLDGDATIDTIEIDDELEDFIKSAIAESEYGDRVRLHIADASEVCRQWPDGYFDMIFMDADKRRYCEYYELCKRLLRRGGYIIADNTLWDGHVVQSDAWKSPQTRGIMEFNDVVAADSGVEVAILPVRDGLSIIRKLS